MKIIAERWGFGLDSTAGSLYVPGQQSCWTLEDQYQKDKVAGETCIPEGEYRITLRTVGGFHGRYGELFPDIHKGMLWLRDVPGFSYILIHAGNTDEDTAGCLLVGEQVHMPRPGEFSVGRSRDAYRRIYPVVAEAIESGDEVTIRVARRWEHLEGA